MRDKHTFNFYAEEIEKAATAEAKYHRERAEHWKQQQAEATARVKATATIKIEEVGVTNGSRLHVGVEYGDKAAYQLLDLAYQKVQAHIAAAERFETDARVYGSQDATSVYELDTADVHYFRLGGQPRED